MQTSKAEKAISFAATSSLNWSKRIVLHRKSSTLHDTTHRPTGGLNRSRKLLGLHGSLSMISTHSESKACLHLKHILGQGTFTDRENATVALGKPDNHIFDSSSATMGFQSLIFLGQWPVLAKPVLEDMQGRSHV